MKMYTHCRRCNRALRSEESRKRGYGSYCYTKVNETTNNSETNDNKVDEDIQIDGQINLLKEVL